jgi:hypothetical protein
MKIKHITGCMCAACLLANVLTWREPLTANGQVAILPQTSQVEDVSHPPHAYYSPITYASNESEAGTATNLIEPIGIASAEALGSPTVTSSFHAL